ncbi:MAG: hypothetical protein A3D47_00400 [Candidatus Colwellbacteria bacterium RIFCSPHIGHO2_02_FULL_43_15]|uniref:Type II secretion system protein GspG C-terminal domain-containing protein n=2 Tax=Candidatus Colwelliibacteriota TaxID=1817904 RepID=A0A1G1Z0E1_9BACT|nr:MAG: hypothetical protein A3D47_00400 [Candidatus Colwellbacteria bacterium RIFCSPHIGHO2_02_FULL_43_15]OGY60645.1 MAG: hypothetical protein A3F99_01435 [Candidatus Colwellbacteria bacterium RIFCSPLOWO2_12_FULL_43_11]
MKNNKGFTLIELLIVLTIIAILSGAALAALSGFRSSARDTRRIADMGNMQSYLELYFNRCGHYPGDVSCGTNAPASWDALADALVAVMDKNKVPLDPVAGKTYSYGVDSANGYLKYVIGATLEGSNSVLNTDVDATTFSVSCADATFVYCIQS